MNNFQDEQNQLMEKIVFKDLYSQLNYETRQDYIFRFVLELYVTAKCNKNCEYCYLQKHQTDLYPPEYDKPELILKNCNILLSDLIERKVIITEIDIFSGELLGTKLGFDILDILYNKLQNGSLGVKSIMIPSNMSFLDDSEITNKIQEYINNFREKNINLIISASDDGLILDNLNRPLKGKEQNKNENFYEKLGKFCNKNNYGFHPMVNAHAIQYWKDNIRWWQKYITQDLKRSYTFKDVCFLEVRNDEWDDNSIEKYLEFLYECIQIWNEDLTNNNFLARKIVIPKEKDTFEVQFLKLLEIQELGYSPLRVGDSNRSSCSLTQAICIRLGDLALCQCHRLSYNGLLYGKFKIENDKIVGINALNPVAMINNYYSGCKGYMKCDACPIGIYCIKGCHGSQYEINDEPLVPIKSVCSLEKAKFIFLVTYIIKIISDNNLENMFQKKINCFTRALQQLKNEDKEEYYKWMKITQKLILKH